LIYEPLHEAADRHGTDEGDVHRQDEESVAPAPQFPGPGLDGAEHALVVVRVDDGAAAGPIQEGDDLFAPVAHHDDHLVNACPLEEVNGMLYECLPADLDQGLKGRHAGGFACRRDEGGEGKLSHGKGGGRGVR
jgi:hypothetical protein